MLSVNQNMRYDQSMRVLKQILDRGDLGDSCSRRSTCTPSRTGRPSCEDYDRLTLANMSVHHLDVLRFLFGDADEIYHAGAHGPAHHVRPHRRHHRLDAEVRRRACSRVSLEDVWSGPREEGFDSDIWISWRVEGIDGVAKGTIGWPTGRSVDAHLRLEDHDRRQVGDADLGDACGSRTPSSA